MKMTILLRWNASPHGIIDRAITLSADKSTPHGSARHQIASLGRCLSLIYARYSVFLTHGDDHVMIGSSIENEYMWYSSKYKTKHEWYHSGYLYTIAQDDKKKCMTLEMGAKRDKTQGPARNEMKQNSSRGIECKRVNPQS